MTQEVKLMVGIPASGKSTWIKREVEALENEHKTTAVISRDYVREHMLQPGEDYFARETEVFNEFVRQINEAIALGIDVVFIDATHVNHASRNKVLSRLVVDPNTSLTLEVMLTSAATCLNRNSKRTGFAKIPNSAIQKMAKSFKVPEISEFPKNRWGFKNIKINIHGE